MDRGRSERPSSAAGAPIGDVAVLRRCSLFAALSIADLRAVYRDARRCRIAKGSVVFRQGDPAGTVYVLIGGQVKLVRAGARGRQLILGFLQPPDVFGYVALLHGTNLYAAWATEDGEALTWNAPTMLRLMRTFPTIALNGLRSIAERIEADWGRLQDFATATVAQRLARALVGLARSTGEAAVALPRQDLAEYVGTTPPTLSRILGRWKHRGIVSATRDTIFIPRLDELKVAAEDTGLPASGGRGGAGQRTLRTHRHHLRDSGACF